MKKILMKKILILLIFTLPLSAYPQLPNTTYITTSAGLSIPANQQIYNTSFNTGVSIEFAMSKLTAIGFDANFANLSSNKYDVGLHVAIIGAISGYDYGNYRTMGLMAFFKLQNAEAVKLPVQPFVKLGLGASLLAKTGMSTSSYDIIHPLPSTTSTGILIAPSMGMNFMVNEKNKIVLEAQFKLNKSSTDEVNTFLLNMGSSFRL